MKKTSFVNPNAALYIKYSFHCHFWSPNCQKLARVFHVESKCFANALPVDHFLRSVACSDWTKRSVH